MELSFELIEASDVRNKLSIATFLHPIYCFKQGLLKVIDISVDVEASVNYSLDSQQAALRLLLFLECVRQTALCFLSANRMNHKDTRTASGD